MQLIILGMHRSGTSMVTRLINMMGAYFGPEKSSVGFNKDNAKGFWERQDVMNYNDTILKGNGCEWNKIAAWNPAMLRPLEQPFRRMLRNLILDMDAHRPWVMKDPRFCLTLPYWQPFLEVPVAIIVYRDPNEIAASLTARNNIPHAHGIALWEHYAVYLLNHSRNMPRIFIKHADMMHDPVVAMGRLYGDLLAHEVQGLRLPSQREIRAFVDPKLYRAKPPEAIRRELTPIQLHTAATLAGAIPQELDLRVSDESVDIMRSIT